MSDVGSSASRLWRHLPSCYGCGPENRSSLGISFEVVDGCVRASATFDERHVGAPGLVHGGIIVTMLDEVMGSTPGAGGEQRVTASLQVDFRRPVRIKEPVIAESRVTEVLERGYLIEATLRHAAEPDRPCATATARFVVLRRRDAG